MLENLINRKHAVNHPNQHHIKKRHWCLGSAVILIGSWITHTTTATIADEATVQELSISNSADFDQRLDAEAIAQVSLNSATADTPVGEAAIAQEPVLSESRHKIRRGDTLGSIFKARKLDLALPHHISKHDTAQQLVKLTIGRELTFKSDDEQLRELHYPLNSLQSLEVHFAGQQITEAEVIDLPYSLQQQTISGEISSSLYETALEVGLSNGMIMEMVRIFGWDIDFVQDIRGGDSFHVIFNDYVIDGEKVADGNILAAEFTTQGHTYRAIRFEDSEGSASYYTPEGESMLGTFLRSPVEFSRISSRFGKRKHPILKKWRAHKGVDYAASRGTPIRATADGKVLLAGKKGGYGKAVVLRHAGRFSTLYGHMNGFAKGIRSGSRVKQGQVIGYIGSTGLATGPHLHYEFRVDGVHRNPLTYKTPKASSVSADQKNEFTALAQSWEQKLATTAKSYQLARASQGTATAM